MLLSSTVSQSPRLREAADLIVGASMGQEPTLSGLTVLTESHLVVGLKRAAATVATSAMAAAAEVAETARLVHFVLVQPVLVNCSSFAAEMPAVPD